MSTSEDGLDRSPAPSIEKPPHSPLEVFADDEGSLALGWVGPGVLYARMMGSFSAGLGEVFLARLRALIDSVPAVHYFADASALEQYDLAVRSAFARFVIAERPKFASLVLLTWNQGISPAARAFAATVGEPCEILDDSMSFDRKLLSLAPQVRKKLDPKTWVPMGVPVPG